MVEELTNPLLDNQVEIQSKIENQIMVKINELTDQMEGVCYALYKSDNPDTRFEKIYQKLVHLEAARQKDQISLSD